MKDLNKSENYSNRNFEDIKHIDENGIELNKQDGTMLEELPTPKKSLKQLEKENKRNLKKAEMKNINGGNNNMELWEVLDDNGNPTGEIMKNMIKKFLIEVFII